MGTYENPAMISGPNTGSTSSNIGSKNASQDIKNSEIKKTTEALNNSEPGNGPIQEAMGASINGGGGVSENFSLIDQSGNVDWKGAAGIKDSDDNKILGPSTLENQAATKDAMSENKSTNVSDGGSGSSSYDDIHQEWKEAGGIDVVQINDEAPGEGWDTWQQRHAGSSKGLEEKYGYTMTPEEVKHHRKDGTSMYQGEGAVPESGLHRTEDGSIIDTRQQNRSIIYKKPTQKSNTSSTSSNTSSTSSNTESTAQKPQPIDPTAGMNRRQVNKAWRQQNNMGIDGKPLAETGVTTEIRNQAIKRIKQENKAARQAKMQKKLENNPFKQYKKEYRAMDNKPGGIAGYGKIKNARQYAKAKTTPTLGEAYKQKRENSKTNIVNLNTKNGNTKVYDPTKPEGKKVYWTNKQSK